MSHGVMCFWFLLNFLLILASFDSLALPPISPVFPSVLQADENPLVYTFPEQ